MPPFVSSSVLDRPLSVGAPKDQARCTAMAMVPVCSFAGDRSPNRGPIDFHGFGSRTPAVQWDQWSVRSCNGGADLGFTSGFVPPGPRVSADFSAPTRCLSLNEEWARGGISTERKHAAQAVLDGSSRVCTKVRRRRRMGASQPSCSIAIGVST